MKRTRQWMWAAVIPCVVFVVGCPGMKKAIGEARNRANQFYQARQAGTLDQAMNFYHASVFADPRAGGKEGWKKQMEAFAEHYGRVKSWVYYPEFDYKAKVGTNEQWPGKQVSLKVDVVGEKMTAVEELTWYKPADGSSDWVIIRHKWTPKGGTVAPVTQPQP